MPDDAQIDDDHLAHAVRLGESVRAVSPPNPWVGCLLVAADGRTFDGATTAVGGPHAEAVALAAAGAAARGATAYVTLEPCSHQGRTPPCADALIAAGVRRVVVGIPDPDAKVAGMGITRLRDAGVVVDVVDDDAARDSLAPYLIHRRTGRPYVVLKLAATLDGATAAPDGSSQWITGQPARRDAHELRAASDVIIVGSGTVVADDPSLTVRHVSAPRGDPQRIVLGTIPPGAKVLPARAYQGALDDLLDELGSRQIIQVLVEGGAAVAHAFHQAGLVDRYVFYLAPALAGGDDARGLFSGSGAQNIGEFWRGRVVSAVRLGDDLRVDLVPASHDVPSATPK